MPTAARLVAALWFGVLGFYVSGLIMPLLPEGTQFGFFAYVNAGLGVILGWNITGSRAGSGMQSAIGAGLTTSLAMVAWGLLIHSTVVMVENAMKMRYNGPVDAVIDVFNLVIKYAQVMATPGVIVTLVIGGALGGILTEWAGRRWA